MPRAARTPSRSGPQAASAAAASAPPAAAAAATSAARSMEVDSTDDENDESESKHQSSSSSSSSSASGVPSRFAGQSLYEVLGVPRDATAEQIKKGYRRTALAVHPDLNKAPTATAEFQYLRLCHEVLSDAGRRARYDASGSLDESADSASSEDAYAHWRGVFPQINLDDIEAFQATYVGSAEELEDLLAAHQRYGTDDLPAVLSCVPFSSGDTAERLLKLLSKEAKLKLTKKDIAEAIRAFVEEEGEGADDEAEEAEEAMKQLLSKKEQALLKSAPSGGTDGLALIFQQRQKERERSGQAFLAHMESKYAGNGKSSKKSDSAAPAAAGKKSKRKAEEEGGAMNEPSDAEFAAIQARMLKPKPAKVAADSSPAKRRKK